MHSAPGTDGGAANQTLPCDIGENKLDHMKYSETEASSPVTDHEALLERLDRDVVAASYEIDETLIDWLRGLSPLERIEWTLRIARSIEGTHRVP